MRVINYQRKVCLASSKDGILRILAAFTAFENEIAICERDVFFVFI